jgi:hypothetical protein
VNRGLIARASREAWPGTLIAGAGLLVVEAVLAYVLPSFEGQISAVWSQMPFVQTLLRALLGSEAAGQLGPEVFRSIPWAHPAALAVLWAHAITGATRVPAGEVDRGTIDVLLGLPVTRWGLYRLETLVWAASGLVVTLLGAAGNALGSLAASTGASTPWPRFAGILANFYCVYLAVGGGAWLASALADRRGRAIGAAFGFVLASFLLSYLAQFWAPAERLSFLSILKYYRPLAVLHDGNWALADMAVLLGAGGALWAAGGVVFARRDLSTL